MQIKKSVSLIESKAVLSAEAFQFVKMMLLKLLALVPLVCDQIGQRNILLVLWM